MISTIKNKVQRAKKLFESNYGRNYGWFIEINGEIVGKLKNPNQVDMFWEAYEIEPIDLEKAELLKSKNAWENMEFKFKNISLGSYAKDAYPSIPLNQEKMKRRVTMRGLYLHPKGIIEKLTINLIELKHLLSKKVG